MKIHHIGYAVSDIKKSIDEFKCLGFKIDGDLYEDVERKINVQFMMNNNYRIELVSPMCSGSPIDTILKHFRDTPYHICYEVSNINDSIMKLREKRYLLVKPIATAKAINNRNVAFLLKKGLGLLELIEI